MIPSLLNLWDVAHTDIDQIMQDNPSLRGMLFGYVAERKLREKLSQDDRVENITKDDDHDRKNKGDLLPTYKGRKFKIELKSLQTNSIEIYYNGKWIPKVKKINNKHTTNPEFKSINDEEIINGIYRGTLQCDASDKRIVKLPDGSEMSTTCLLVGEFDILAVNLFGFREQWDFAFALNINLPRSSYKKYSPESRQHLLKTSMPITWSIGGPYSLDLFSLMDTLIQSVSQEQQNANSQRGRQETSQTSTGS